jgi:DNA-binding NarL/FixJ family response regulator
MNILLADDHQMMRDGLRALLDHEADLHVVGEAGDGKDVVELCAQLRPDLVVMDISMPGLNGIEATRQLSARQPRVRVVGLSMNADRRYVQAMFQAGAWAYLVKSSAAQELIVAIRAVGRGEKYVSPAIANAVVEGFVSPVAAREEAGQKLTPREREVLQLIAEGLTSKEIAARLDVSPSTIDTHRTKLMMKLDLHSVAELTRYAVREGMTSA